jgi:hypothetical protein
MLLGEVELDWGTMVPEKLHTKGRILRTSFLSWSPASKSHGTSAQAQDKSQTYADNRRRDA